MFLQKLKHPFANTVNLRYGSFFKDDCSHLFLCVDYVQTGHYSLK